MAPRIMATNIFLSNSKIQSSINNMETNMAFICKMQ
jgi:hypothetical protein